MASSSMPIFSLLTSRMAWLSARQSALSQNVANSDTPGYVARDMKPMDFDALVAQSQTSSLATTNSSHITADGGRAGPGLPPLEAPQPTGGKVSLEEEMIKLSDTQVQYQAVTNLYAKAMNMFRTALGVRQGG